MLEHHSPGYRASQAVEEIRRVVDHAPAEALAALAALVQGAERVFCAGHGRSGLVARAVSMRLMHLGLAAFVVGETSTPAIGTGDLLWQFSASGGGEPALHRARTARAAGATVALVTAKPGSALAGLADLVVHVPARHGGVESIQHSGSLFEQVSLVLGDSVAGTLQQQLGLPDSALDTRHANLA